MKKQLFAFIFAAIIATVVNANQAQGQISQTIQADVPFAFTTNGKTLPAGNYRIESINDNRVLWRLSGTDARARTLLLPVIRTGSSADTARLTFHRYGDRYYLAGFSTSFYEIQLPASKTEKAMRQELGPLAKMEVIGIEAAGGGSR
jgi:hypothetical protein